MRVVGAIGGVEGSGSVGGPPWVTSLVDVVIVSCQLRVLLMRGLRQGTRAGLVRALSSELTPSPAAWSGAASTREAEAQLDELTGCRR